MVSLDIDALSVEERLALIDRLWASLPPPVADDSFTPEDWAEIDRRLDDLEREGPVGYLPLDQAMEQVRAELV